MPLTAMRYLFVFLAILGCVPIAQAQKFVENMITVRDGQAIAADMYIRDSTVKKPTILVQTPYNKNFFRLAIQLPQGGGVGLPYDSLQYNYVIADWRGFFGSKDAAKPGYDRGLDGYDLVEWIAAQSWSDGKVGTWGGSALGLIQFQTAKHQPPHLVCAMPFIINFKTEYENYFPGGVFLREHYEQVQSLGLLSTDLILQHPTYDNYWKIAENLTDYPDKINIPLLMLTGWYDHFPDAVIRGYESLRERSAASVKDKHKLVIGPWLHTKVGAAEQGILSYPEAAGVPTDLAFQFFGFYLLGQETAWEARPGVQYFDLGSNTWHTAERWSEVTSSADELQLFLWEKGELREQETIWIKSYSYDPREPSPSIGGSTFNDSLLHGPQDISQSIEMRDDVLLFTTDTLVKDIVVRGSIVAKFWVSTDRTDTDFGIRLCDVYPDGRSIIIADAMQRLRFRHSNENPTLVEANEWDSLAIRLRNLAITFKKGHRLRIVVSSSNFPRYDLNLNNGGALYVPGDTLIASNSIGTLLHRPFFTHVSIPIEPTLAVGTQSQEYEIIAAPNPCNDQTQISLTANGGSAEIRCIDALGRIVKQERVVLTDGKNVIPIDLDGMAAGVYFMQISGHKTGIARVIKSSGP